MVRTSRPHNKQPSWDSMIELHMDRPTPRRRWNLDAATQRNLSDQKCSYAAGYLAVIWLKAKPRASRLADARASTRFRPDV